MTLTYLYSLADLKFSEDHEWVKVEGNIATIGITDHAQDQMGDITFIDEAEVGEEVEQGGKLSHIRDQHRTNGKNNLNRIKKDPMHKKFQKSFFLVIPNSLV